jgi:hypothetical protein
MPVKNRIRTKTPITDPMSGPAGVPDEGHGAPPSPEPPDSAVAAETSYAISILKAVGASAGISGLLAALGYVVHFSQENFLGVPLNGNTSGAFVLEGARFLADLCLFSLSSFVPLLVSAVLAGLLLVAYTAIRKWRVVQRIPSGFWAVLFLVVIFAELACNDLPMVYVSGLLFKSHDELQVGGEFHGLQPLPAPIDRATGLLRDAVVCSRVPKLAGCILGERKAYRDLLQGWFLFNFFATVPILVAGLRALTRWLKPVAAAAGEAPGVTPFWGLLSALLSLALLLELFGLPFAYARTIKQNIFPTALITLSDSKAEKGEAEKKTGEGATLVEVAQDPAGVAAGSPAGAAPEKAQPAQPGDQLWQILSYGEDRFVLYSKLEARVLSVPKELVQIIRIRNEEDVLESYLLRAK